MRGEDQLQALHLIEQAALAIQARHHPGRPMFYAMDRLCQEVRRARREAALSVAVPDLSRRA
jgi:hypothetical protein